VKKVLKDRTHPYSFRTTEKELPDFQNRQLFFVIRLKISDHQRVARTLAGAILRYRKSGVCAGFRRFADV